MNYKRGLECDIGSGEGVVVEGARSNKEIVDHKSLSDYEGGSVLKGVRRGSRMYKVSFLFRGSVEI